MPKFRDYFRQMLDQNQEIFGKFSEVHAKYQLDKATWQDEFNKEGAAVLMIVREWEGRLCGHTEKGTYAKYSSNLADKFWQEVKAFFPLIDFVGVKVVKPATKIAPKSELETPQEPVDPDMKEIDDFDPDEFTLKKLF